MPLFLHACIIKLKLEMIYLKAETVFSMGKAETVFSMGFHGPAPIAQVVEYLLWEW